MWKYPILAKLFNIYNLEHQLPCLALIICNGIQNDNDATSTMFDIIVQMVKVPGMLIAKFYQDFWIPLLFPKAKVAITTLLIDRISLLKHEENRGGDIFWQKSREHSAKSVSVKSRKASSLFLSLSTRRSITCILVNKKHPLWKESK